MSHERPMQPSWPSFREVYRFSEQGCLDERLIHDHFQTAIDGCQTIIHLAEVSHINYVGFIEPWRSVCDWFTKVCGYIVAASEPTLGG